eukprot:1861441-Rhodomonas_salina.4
MSVIYNAEVVRPLSTKVFAVRRLDVPVIIILDMDSQPFEDAAHARGKHISFTVSSYDSVKRMYNAKYVKA